MKTMKNGIILFASSVMVFSMLASCESNGTASVDLVANDTQKEEAFNQILSNQELFYEFMDKMMQDTQTMHWMMEDGEFMQHMFSDENMDYMMQHNQQFNSETMRNMMQRYNTDSSLMNTDDMMHQETPMRSE